MTNIEAISLLSDIRAEYNCFTEREKYHSLSMGIEALRVRKCGKWEDIEVTDVSGRTDLSLSSISSMRCSVCNRYHNEVYHYGIPTEMANFCPYCGAQMESGD